MKQSRLSFKPYKDKNVLPDRVSNVKMLTLVSFSAFVWANIYSGNKQVVKMFSFTVHHKGSICVYLIPPYVSNYCEHDPAMYRQHGAMSPWTMIITLCVLLEKKPQEGGAGDST